MVKITKCMIDMLSILDTEIIRLKNEKNKILTIYEKYKEFSNNPHHKELFSIINNIYEEIECNIEDIIKRLTENIPNEHKIENITDFKNRIKTLVNFFYNVIINTFEIPREIYHFCDVFQLYYETKFKYILFISEEIAMMSLSTLLKYIGFEEYIPDFLRNIEEKENFYFIMIISEYSKTETSLNWPIILHEISHCIIDHYKIYNQYINYINIDEALDTINNYYIDHRPTPPFLLLESRRKLYITEHLADLLVTWSFGAIYGWRFIIEILTLLDVLEYPLTHPTSDKRIEKITQELVENLGMRTSSEYLRKLIEEHQIRALEREHLLDLEPELSRAIDYSRNLNKYKLNMENIEKSIKKTRWSHIFMSDENHDINKLLLKLHDDLLEGIPIIIEPPVLYYLFTLNFEDIDRINQILQNEKRSKYIKDLLSDIIRMFFLQKYYLNNI